MLTSRAAGRSREHVAPQAAGGIDLLPRSETASAIGTCVNSCFQKPTTMSVRPAMPACTALCARARAEARRRAFAGALRIA
jgi:hypothetical protein